MLFEKSKIIMRSSSKGNRPYGHWQMCHLKTNAWVLSCGQWLWISWGKYAELPIMALKSRVSVESPYNCTVDVFLVLLCFGVVFISLLQRHPFKFINRWISCLWPSSYDNICRQHHWKAWAFYLYSTGSQTKKYPARCILIIQGEMTCNERITWQCIRGKKS